MAQQTATTVRPQLATTPVPRTSPDADWWPPRHDAKLAERDKWLESDKPLRLVFLGDSITHSWENNETAKQIWQERYAPYGAMNLGYSGDRTEHVLWRLGAGPAGEENNELKGLSPEVVVLMIGTNNTGHRQDPPEATAEGIEAIVTRLHEISPQTHVLLLGVFPRGVEPDDPLRQINTAINDQIAALGERDGVTYVDIGAAFLDDSGVLSPEIMPDALHPNDKGYELWADAIAQHLRLLLGG
ncbi:GDSL-type esterase/lipase family protein [Botrimarina sp.]|uniref:GDSL-type esterase/lipase family protein n=1 Tax=Botrimarina sp. TaxID=2795802 RepID=UPI0032EDF7B4